MNLQKMKTVLEYKEKMTDRNLKLEGKFVKSIEAKELGKLATDFSELGLDSLLDEGLIRDIPFLKTVVGLIKTGLNIRDRLYVKKVYCFFAQIGQMSHEQRDAFVRENCQNGKRFEEAVLLILEQADRIEKATLIGKIFKACILGVIEYQGACLLSDMVNRSFWSDLVAMFDHCENPHQKQRLFVSGLYENDGDIGWNDIGDLKVKRNKYATALQNIHFEFYEQVKRIKN